MSKSNKGQIRTLKQKAGIIAQWINVNSKKHCAYRVDFYRINIPFNSFVCKKVKGYIDIKQKYYLSKVAKCRFMVDLIQFIMIFLFYDKLNNQFLEYKDEVLWLTRP
jgi:hypothetical protein